MEINDFQDLTQFIEDEYQKSSDVFRTTKPSEKTLKMIDNEIIKYSLLYSKVIYEREKRKIAFDEALRTMPHGKIWQFFHPSLWRQIQEYEAKNHIDVAPIKASEQAISLVPTILKPMEVVTVDENTEDEED